MKKFNSSLADSQASTVSPVPPEQFDFAAYEAYAAGLNERCKEFWESESGVLVYRRMRVAECFSFGCHDKKRSLELQLGLWSKA